jgi:hypothetical protein
MAERFTPLENDRDPPQESRESPLFFERLHRALHRWNVRRHRPELPTRRWREEVEEDLRMRTLEGEWIEAERTVVAGQAREVPRSPDAFARWLAALDLDAPGRRDPLLGWIAARATLDQVHWFLQQELVTEAGLDVLVALTRLRISPGHAGQWTRGGGRPGRPPRLESAGPDTVWEALAVSNLLVGLASNRRYTWLAVGALAAADLTARDRVDPVDRALRRLGVGGQARVRAEASGRSCEPLLALLEEDPERAPFLAEGALLRHRAGLRCVRRYRSELGVRTPERDAD